MIQHRGQDSKNLSYKDLQVLLSMAIFCTFYRATLCKVNTMTGLFKLVLV